MARRKARIDTMTDKARDTILAISLCALFYAIGFAAGVILITLFGPMGTACLLVGFILGRCSK